MIAPTFESLANKHAKPKRIAFAKVDVDNQREIAQQYGVRAMPTFVILRNGSVLETVQGANPPALTAAVERAVKLATSGGATFSTPGRTLGSDSASTSTAAGIRIGGGISRPAGSPIQGHRSRFSPTRIFQWLVAFFGLYLTSLFSVCFVLFCFLFISLLFSTSILTYMLPPPPPPDRSLHGGTELKVQQVSAVDQLWRLCVGRCIWRPHVQEPGRTGVWPDSRSVRLGCRAQEHDGQHRQQQWEWCAAARRLQDAGGPVIRLGSWERREEQMLSMMLKMFPNFFYFYFYLFLRFVLLQI